MFGIYLNTGETNKTFTLNADTEVYYDIQYATNGQVFENLSFYVQLEEGDTATTYEPYFVTSTVPVTLEKDHTLTAIWEANKYTLTLDSNGGALPNVTGWTRSADYTTATKSVPYNTEYGLFNVPTPTKPGYTFDGWYAEAEFENRITSATVYDTLDDTTIYAKWTANDYTVTLDANGGTLPATQGWTGSGATLSKTVTYDTAYGELPEPNERTGYTFKGWTGKNLLNYNDVNCTVSLNGTIVVNPDDGYIRYTSSYDGRGWRILSHANWKQELNAGNYTLSLDFKVQTSASGDKRMRVYTEDEEVDIYQSIDSVDKKVINFSLSEKKDVYIIIKGMNGVYRIQLEEGDIATTWEPYNLLTTVKLDYDHTLTAMWEANELEFEDQDIKNEYSSSAQTASITEASNGTGTYTYAVKSETNEEGTDTNYISISGTTINIAAGTPCGLYTVVVTATDSNSGATKDATYNIQVGSSYTVNHYGHNLGSDTYALMQTETKYGESGEAIAITEANLGKTIAGFTYVEGFLSGDTTKPTTTPDTDTTILADESTEINLYYRRNYLYVQYEVNGGTLASGANFGLDGTLVTYTGNEEPTKFLQGVYGSKVNGMTSIDNYTFNTLGLNNWNNSGSINIKKTGYVAKTGAEWNTMPDGSGIGYNHGTNSYNANTFGGVDLSQGDQVVTLYVDWQYQITYVLNGGINPSSNPKTYIDLEDDIVLANPTKVGYTFLGWTGSNGETPELDVTIPKESTGAKTFTANWDGPNDYTLTFDANGGEVVEDTKTVTYGQTYTDLPVPTRDGYVFKGWYATFNGNVASTINYGRAYMYNDEISIHVSAYKSKWTNSQLISCQEDGGWTITNASNRIQYNCYKSGTGYVAATSSVLWSSLTPGWHDFDLVFDGEYVHGYLDGVEIATSASYSTKKIGYHANNSIFIGAEATGNPITPKSPYFNGYIGNIIIEHSDQLIPENTYTTFTAPAQDVTLYARWEQAPGE